jgi:hypothetical protein
MRLGLASRVGLALAICAASGLSPGAGLHVAAAQATPAPTEYRVLATNRTSTMDREMNQAAETGFRFSAVMGGETGGGGSEVVVVMARSAGDPAARYAYRLLATSRTSTMQRELQAAADAGFEFKGQTIFSTAFGGDEVVAILERDLAAAPPSMEYRLLATTKTSTLEKELAEAAAAGFTLVGMTVASTAIGGDELVAIVRRPKIQ